MPNTLIDQYFLTFPEGVLSSQGQILSQLAPGFYLVRYYDWLVGQESNQGVASLEIMATEHWRFWTDADFWKKEGERLSRFADQVSDQAV